jgi:hypothetical protein
MEEFLEVSIKLTPEERFRQGDLQLAMLKDRYATESNPVPPATSWCMTLGALDSLQVTYQPRPHVKCLKCPGIPFGSAGVDEVVKEHPGRVQAGGNAEEAAATVPENVPASSIVSISGAALAAGSGCAASQGSDATELAVAEAKMSQNACADAQQTAAAASRMFPEVWKEARRPLGGLEDRREEEKRDVGKLLATAEGRCSENMRVDADMLAGTVKMDADALAGAAAGLDTKQCRMM